jgi:hypothetical protein
VGVRGVLLAAVVAVMASLTVPSVSAAANNPWPHEIVNGFSTPTGDGFWLVFADGSVQAYGDARHHGDASHLPLAGPLVGGGVTPSGHGYWLVAEDGGIFSYGDARFFGSMGGIALDQPVFSMTSTKDGRGYWLVAFDGGIFSFGNAAFFGSMGGIPLDQPINGISTSPSGRGYRMVARDGGIFSFGDVPFFGSLPGLGLVVSDVVGMAPTPTNRGYWIVRSGGQVYAFGDAQSFGNLILPEHPPFSGTPDPVAAIFSNPTSQGYRLVTRSGATIPFGAAPGGDRATESDTICPSGTVTIHRTSFTAAPSFSPAFWDVTWVATLHNGTNAAVDPGIVELPIVATTGTEHDLAFFTPDPVAGGNTTTAESDWFIESAMAPVPGSLALESVPDWNDFPAAFDCPPPGVVVLH